MFMMNINGADVIAGADTLAKSSVSCQTGSEKTFAALQFW
jgi:hypothetical protein